MTTTGLWQRFEATIENHRLYDDPYRDVTVQVTFRRPGGATVQFWGFYDGGATWKLRFMPDQTGEWTYSARFSDGAAASQGSFTCVASDTPGVIAADTSNPMWFGYTGGKHVLIRSLHVGDAFFAANLPAGQRTAFLDWAQGQGYNMLSIASHYLNRAEPGRGQGWQTPRLWPLDAAEFRRAETILDDLAARGMMVFPFAGFFGRGSNFPTAPADQELYVRYVLARWGAYWNIMFNVAGPEPLLVKNPFLTETWPTFGTLQGPKTTDLAVLSDGLLRNHHPARPLYVQETLWSGNKHGHPDYSDRELRQNAYVIMMSAGALKIADNGGPDPAVVGDSSSGFSGSLDLADRRQWRHDIVKTVWDVFESLPFVQMKPAQHVVSTGYCLAEPGKQYLVYLPTGGAVDVAVAGGPYNILWINAQETCRRQTGGQTADGRNLTAPPGGDDWLAYLWR